MASKLNPDKNQHQSQEARISDLIPKLRDVLSEEHNLDISERNNEFLARCLRLKDGNLEKAVKLVAAFPKMCSELASWNISVQPSFYKKSWFDVFAFFPLAIRDSENRRIIIIQQGKWDTNQLTCAEALMAGGLLLQYAVSHNLDDQRNGFITVWDFTGFSLNHVLAVKHWSLLTMTKCVQNGGAGRIKNIHIINHPKPISLIHSALKPFMSQKMKNRVHFHDNLSTLIPKLDVDAKFLPKLMGGDLQIEECIDKQFMQDLLNSDAFFQDMFKHGFPRK